MNKNSIIAHLYHTENQVHLADLATIIPKRPGLYAIFIKQKKRLPEPFSNYLSEVDTNLIYIGEAKKSLYKRLYEQDLRHKHPSTFFRSIGAILGYRPPVGSLENRSNQYNYKFSKEDSAMIINWINDNLFVSWFEMGNPSKFEKQIISKLCPITNISHNPKKIKELEALREECRDIACKKRITR